MAQGTGKTKTSTKTACLVTGGPDGTASVEVGGARYNPGEQVMLGPDDRWLLEQGYVREQPTGKTKAEAPAPAPADEEGEG